MLSLMSKLVMFWQNELRKDHVTMKLAGVAGADVGLCRPFCYMTFCLKAAVILFFGESDFGFSY